MEAVPGHLSARGARPRISADPASGDGVFARPKRGPPVGRVHARRRVAVGAGAGPWRTPAAGTTHGDLDGSADEYGVSGTADGGSGRAGRAGSDVHPQRVIGAACRAGKDGIALFSVAGRGVLSVGA